MTRVDRSWRYYGRTDPYYGVLTQPQFKSENLHDPARASFFLSGEDYVEYVLAVLRQHLDGSFQPHRVLDFGCGVGRLTLPLAKRCDSVVGVDVSESMLAEGSRNARLAGLTNITWVTSDDQLTQVEGSFDLIHSFIVFQHLPRHRGLAVAGQLLRRLQDEGIGILHFTYADSSTRRPSRWRRSLTAAYQVVPPLYGLRNLLKRAPLSEPPMQMNLYDLNGIFRLLQESGCHDVHVRFTEASHYNLPIYGAIIFFRKHKLDTARYS